MNENSKKIIDRIISAVGYMMSDDGTDQQLIISFKDGSVWMVGHDRIYLFNTSHQWIQILSEGGIFPDNIFIEPNNIETDIPTHEDVETHSESIVDELTRSDFQTNPSNSRQQYSRSREAMIDDALHDLLAKVKLSHNSEVQDFLCTFKNVSHLNGVDVVSIALSILSKELAIASNSVNASSYSLPVTSSCSWAHEDSARVPIQMNASRDSDSKQWNVQWKMTNGYFMFPVRLSRFCKDLMYIVSTGKFNNLACDLRPTILSSVESYSLYEGEYRMMNCQVIASLMKCKQLSTSKNAFTRSNSNWNSHRFQNMTGDWELIKAQFPNVFNDVYQMVTSDLVSGLSEDDGILFRDVEAKIPQIKATNRLSITICGVLYTDVVLCNDVTSLNYLPNRLTEVRNQMNGIPCINEKDEDCLLDLVCCHDSDDLCDRCSQVKRDVFGDSMPTSILMRHFFNYDQEAFNLTRGSRPAEYLMTRSVYQSYILAMLTIDSQFRYCIESSIFKLARTDKSTRIDVLLIGPSSVAPDGYEPIPWEFYRRIPDHAKHLLCDIVVVLPCVAMTEWERKVIHNDGTLGPPIRSGLWLHNVIQFYRSLDHPVPLESPCISGPTKSTYYPMGKSMLTLPEGIGPMEFEVVLVVISSDSRLLQAMIVELADRTTVKYPSLQIDVVASENSQLFGKRLREASSLDRSISVIFIDDDHFDHCAPSTCCLSPTDCVDMEDVENQQHGGLSSFAKRMMTVLEQSPYRKMKLYSTSSGYFYSCYDQGAFLPFSVSTPIFKSS
eukprot:GHVH01008774.1.p1 GENE.GHVH01008774.1~~GHVH01008774.1.p1  ORF type:complete len:780 (+),score=112.91 GHVH01008774.1:607-2946(+)